MSSQRDPFKFNFSLSLGPNCECDLNGWRGEELFNLLSPLYQHKPLAVEELFSPYSLKIFNSI